MGLIGRLRGRNRNHEDPPPPPPSLPPSKSLDRLAWRVAEEGYAALEEDERAFYGIPPCRGGAPVPTDPQEVLSAVQAAGGRGFEGLLLGLADRCGWNRHHHACELHTWVREVIHHDLLGHHVCVTDPCAWGRWGVFGLSFVDVAPIAPPEAPPSMLLDLETSARVAVDLIAGWGGATPDAAARLTMRSPVSALTETRYQREFAAVLAAWREWQIRFEAG